MLDQRRSFSFSSSDCNSSNNSASLFSSSTDDFFASNFIMYDTEDDDGDNDDGAYIEINLDPPRKMVLEDKEFKNSNSSEMELRISFSSTGIPPTTTTTTTTTCGTTQHAYGTTTTTTTTTTKPRRGRLFVSLARIVNEFIAASSVKTSSSVRAIEANNNVAHENGPAHVLPLSKSDGAEIIRTRNDCTIVPSKNNGIMNFIVKLKYKNIPSMLISMVTPKPKNGQIRARQPLLQRGRSSTSRGKDPMNNNNNYLMKQKTRNHSDLNHQDINHNKSTSGIINFKAMRGVLDALIVKTSRYCTSATTTGGLLSGNKQNSSKSCPSSIKSSPLHSNVCDDDVRKFYSRDNSVQAAIAHCKKSFGTQAEFDFHI